jgi:hypothetical protein
MVVNLVSYIHRETEALVFIWDGTRIPPDSLPAGYQDKFGKPIGKRLPIQTLDGIRYASIGQPVMLTCGEAYPVKMEVLEKRWMEVELVL